MCEGTQKPLLGTPINYTHPLACGLVGSWVFNEGAGTHAADTSGNGNHGTLTGFAQPATAASGWGPSERGGALSFDGTNDFVDCESNASLTSSQGTMELWIKANTIDDDRDLLFLRNGGADFFLIRRAAANVIRLFIKNNWVTTVDITSNITIGDTNWHHIGVTQDGVAARIYIDGVESGVAGTNAGDWTNHIPLLDCWIGKGAWSVFTGSIDKANIYNCALRAAEIGWLYHEPYAMFEVDDTWILQGGLKKPMVGTNIPAARLLL